MPRWARGSSQIVKLLEARELQRIAASNDAASGLLDMATAHVAAAKVCVQLDAAGALALAYDATRKAATAVLAHQGLRPTTKGGHLVVVYAVEAQFPGVPGLRALDRLRRRRNETEYPDPEGYDPIRTEEADEAVKVAEAAIETVRTLIDRPEVGLFR